MSQWRQPLLRQARDILAANNRPDEPHLSTFRARAILDGQLDISMPRRQETREQGKTQPKTMIAGKESSAPLYSIFAQGRVAPARGASPTRTACPNAPQFAEIIYLPGCEELPSPAAQFALIRGLAAGAPPSYWEHLGLDGDDLAELRDWSTLLAELIISAPLGPTSDDWLLGNTGRVSTVGQQVRSKKLWSFFCREMYLFTAAISGHPIAEIADTIMYERELIFSDDQTSAMCGMAQHCVHLLRRSHSHPASPERSAS